MLAAAAKEETWDSFQGSGKVQSRPPFCRNTVMIVVFDTTVKHFAELLI